MPLHSILNSTQACFPITLIFPFNMQTNHGGGGKSIKRDILVGGGVVVTRVRCYISKTLQMSAAGPWTTFWVARSYKIRAQTIKAK